MKNKPILPFILILILIYSNLALSEDVIIVNDNMLDIKLSEKDKTSLHDIVLSPNVVTFISFFDDIYGVPSIGSPYFIKAEVEENRRVKISVLPNVQIKDVGAFSLDFTDPSHTLTNLQVTLVSGYLITFRLKIVPEPSKANYTVSVNVNEELKKKVDFVNAEIKRRMKSQQDNFNALLDKKSRTEVLKRVLNGFSCSSPDLFGKSDNVVFSVHNICAYGPEGRERLIRFKINNLKHLDVALGKVLLYSKDKESSKYEAFEEENTVVYLPKNKIHFKESLLGGISFFVSKDDPSVEYKLEFIESQGNERHIIIKGIKF